MPFRYSGRKGLGWHWWVGRASPTPTQPRPSVLARLARSVSNILRRCKGRCHVLDTAVPLAHARQHLVLDRPLKDPNRVAARRGLAKLGPVGELRYKLDRAPAISDDKDPNERFPWVPRDLAMQCSADSAPLSAAVGPLLCLRALGLVIPRERHCANRTGGYVWRKQARSYSILAWQGLCQASELAIHRRCEAAYRRVSR
jgi:hypothetical protein